ARLTCKCSGGPLPRSAGSPRTACKSISASPARCPPACASGPGSTARRSRAACCTASRGGPCETHRGARRGGRLPARLGPDRRRGDQGPRAVPLAAGVRVKRTEIAVVGAPSNGALRLELSGCPGEDGLVLELLHDDRQTGTLARVVAGRVGLGEVSVPVAVKLQRDIALSQEDRGSVAANFDQERNVH